MRGTWANDLIGLAVGLSTHGSTPYPAALDLPLSYANAYFETDAYRQHLKVIEAQQKLDVSVVERLNTVIQAIGNLGRALGGRR